MKKSLKHGSISAVTTAVVIAAVILTNIIATLIAERFDVRIDITPDGMFSLSPETQDFLSALTDNVTITVASREHDFLTFAPNSAEHYTQTNEILKRFAAFPRVTLRYIDFMSNPDFAKKYDGLIKGSIVIESEGTGRHKLLNGNDYFAVEYYDLVSGERLSMQEVEMYVMYGMGERVHSAVFAGAETAFVSAVLSVTDTNPVFVGMTTGHGENDNKLIESLLNRNAYITSPLDLVLDIGGGIDTALDCLFINAPSADFDNDILRKINTWLDNGGKFGKRLVYIADHSSETPNIDAFLTEWGVEVERAFVVRSDPRTWTMADMNSDVQYYKAYEFTVGNPDYEIYGEFMRNVRQIFTAQYERGGDALIHGKNNIETRAILTSLDNSALLPFEALDEGTAASGKWALNNAERGAFDVGVWCSKARFEGLDVFTSDVVVFGGSNVFGSGFLGMRNSNNAEYLIAVMNKVCGKDPTAQIKIAPKTFTMTMFNITKAQSTMLGVVFAVVMPIAVIVTGMVVWVRRRRV